MRKVINVDELKKIQLEILNEIANYCEKLNLRYFLGYGSLIGAIRHKGYIPWDDDIDIVMPRPDYDLLMKSFNEKSKNIKVVCPQNDKDYYLPFGKAYDNRTVLHETQFKENAFGVYVDIFPLDGFGNDGKTVLKKIKWLNKFVNTKKAVFNSDRTILKKMIIALGKFVLFPISIHKILLKMENLAKNEEYTTSNTVNSMYSPYAEREFCPKSYVEKLKKVPFEQYSFFVPVEFDKYLRLIYGDYMKLPPVEKRCAHHQFEAWWK